jgi:hypothetical protein
MLADRRGTVCRLTKLLETGEKMRRIALAVAVMSVAFASAPGVASAFNCGVSLDNFNRANSANLGPNWAQQANAIGIQSNAATNAAANTALATFNPRGAPEACVDVATGGAALQYVAIVLRYASNNDNVFIKVQDNVGPDGAFDTAFFYYGNNGIGGPNLRSSAALTPFAQGRIHVAVRGTNGRLDVDTDFDNKPEQSFTFQNIPTAALGSLIGLGNYGGAIMDNFRTATPQTTITKHPSKTTGSSTARFKFKSSLPPSTFKCKFDGQRYKRCSSPKTYRNLSNGRHTFRVRAKDAFGNVDPTPAKFSWRIT